MSFIELKHYGLCCIWVCVLQLCYRPSSANVEVETQLLAQIERGVGAETLIIMEDFNYPELNGVLALLEQ